MTAQFEISGWEVRFAWEQVEGAAPRRGPSRMTIQPADDDGDVASRGLTSTVLRRLEAVLVDATEEYEARRPKTDPSQLDRLVAQLQGCSPRGRTDPYYQQLSQAYALIADSGSRRPVLDLAERLGLKPATLKTQLLAAKRSHKPER